MCCFKVYTISKDKGDGISGQYYNRRSKVNRKSPIRVDSVSGDSFWVEDELFPTIVKSPFECRKIKLQV